MKSYSFLFWAYNVVWIGLALYLWMMVRRLEKMDRRLTELESDQESKGS